MPAMSRPSVRSVFAANLPPLRPFSIHSLGVQTMVCSCFFLVFPEKPPSTAADSASLTRCILAMILRCSFCQARDLGLEAREVESCLRLPRGSFGKATINMVFWGDFPRWKPIRWCFCVGGFLLRGITSGQELWDFRLRFFLDDFPESLRRYLPGRSGSGKPH